ncbi:MAG: hypothetical protein EHM60_00060 [Lysobacterales bacterium]|jgi:hypothetical protein|nr:MAG: hypothetical protein EHM60_08185 [Xanthomonadales bacterium]RPI17355.1 MAG: hypothetical protein EHM60_00060 [Xanthomonadales bacterium]
MNERRNSEGAVGGDAGSNTSSGESGRQLPVAACGAAWDPYDVWLKRVKQPRDARVRKSAVRAVPADTVAAGTTQATAMSPPASNLSLAPTR